MCELLKSLDGQRYEGIMDLMYALQHAGFTSEFYNSLIMRMAWLKIDEVKVLARQDVSVHFTAKLQPNPIHEWDLIITIHADYIEEAQAIMVLFIRNNNIAVSTNVITEEIKPHSGDIPAAGASVYWFEAERAFKENKRFSKTAFNAFKAVFKSVAPKGNEIGCRLHILPNSTGWTVGYQLDLKVILSVAFSYN